MNNECKECTILRHQLYIQTENNQQLLEQNQEMNSEIEDLTLKLNLMEETMKKYRTNLINKL